MANPLFRSSPFGFHGVQNVHGPSEDHKKEGFIRKGNEGGSLSIEELGQIYPLCSGSGTQNNIATEGLQGFFKHQKQLQQGQQRQQQQPKPNYVPVDEYLSSCFQTPARPLQDVDKVENVSRPRKKVTHPSFESSLELLTNYRSKMEKSKMKQLSNSATSSGSRPRMSPEEIISVAGARYIQISNQKYYDFSTTMHPFGYALGGLSQEETWDVELAHILLAAAEKVGNQQFDGAIKLLTLCEQHVYERVTPFQRVIYSFAEALRKRIDKAMGKFSTKVSEVNRRYEILQGLSVEISFLIYDKKVPLNQAMQLTSIQAIIENMGSMRKLHLIDLEIRSGVQWTALMQALGECDHRPIKHLKITAVSRSMDRVVDGIGKSLECFAESMNLPFTFDAVYISSFSDLKVEQFEIAADESLVIFADKILRTMLPTPNCLETLMTVIRNINPSLMVVLEVEANHNSPTFVDRFIESLFYFSAYFDCFGACMHKNIDHRAAIEAIFSHGIEDIVANEGDERTTRNVKIDVWRAYFSRFKMVEVGFSESAQFQATLVFDRIPFGKLCTIARMRNVYLLGGKECHWLPFQLGSSPGRYLA